ncbi:MAG: bifunctional glutamate N-acetyltransferase/amino-acid acetyltransferase ArgJ [Candidatus Marinimicrobia bacterium]|nr:bifunctional glutamate N-acetyltransferase/amino-acid acetyltransferase ArgJ [Candidatus Neomarinimicrobiota bacterium]
MSGAITVLEGGTVTSPPGFLGGATYAGLKTYAEDKLDLAMIISEAPCVAAGVFTTSTIRSSTITVNQEHLAKGPVRGLVVNAGIANTCVGEQGYKDAQEMTTLAAHRAGLTPDEMLVCSTGIIGVELPMSLISSGIDQIELSSDGGHAVARAMMTTDTRPKEVAVSFELDGHPVQIGGVAKGSGMIHPNMATMLAFITTDAKLEADFLRTTLAEVAGESFNMLTVDGDTSTNDTLLVLANGLAGNQTIDANSPDAGTFRKALSQVCIYLTRELARDGEGASRLIIVEVAGAKNRDDARKAARTVASSNLVKSAVNGADPNWGRVMMALGRSGAAAEETKIDLFVNGVCIMEAGSPIPFHRDAVVSQMRGPEVTFRLQLNLGDGEAIAWGCDLTEEYVIINSAYTT